MRNRVLSLQQTSFPYSIYVLPIAKLFHTIVFVSDTVVASFEF